MKSVLQRWRTASLRKRYGHSFANATSYFKADPARLKRIRDYTDHDYIDINTALLMGRQAAEKKIGAAKADAIWLKKAKLQKDLADAPKLPGMVYRGTYMPVDNVSRMISEGKTYAKNFWSTSRDLATAVSYAHNRPGDKLGKNETRVVFHVDQRSGVDVSGVSAEGGFGIAEKETLIAPGAQFKVVRADQRGAEQHIFLVEV